MDTSSYEYLFQKVDHIIRKCDSRKREPMYSEEIKRRNNRNISIINDDKDVLKRFAELIAYSNNAPSSNVSRMLQTGIFETMFNNYDVISVLLLNEDNLVNKYWNKVSAIRFKKKIKAIIECARIIMETSLKYGSFQKFILHYDIPLELVSDSEIDKFWTRFDNLMDDMKKIRMPHYREQTTLLHFLSEIGYPCNKPDMIVMKVADNLGLCQHSGNKNQDCRNVVKFIQRYSISRKIKPNVIDFYFLIEGEQTDAMKYVVR